MKQMTFIPRENFKAQTKLRTFRLQKLFADETRKVEENTSGLIVCQANC